MNSLRTQYPMLPGEIMSKPSMSDAGQHKISLFLLLLIALAASSTAIAQTTTTLYKSIGPDGKTVYSDRPAPNAREAKTLTFRNAPASPLSAQTLLYIDQLKKSADANTKTPATGETVLFSAVWCVYCKLAKAYLATKKVSYQEVDIDTKDGLLAYARAGGKQGVPLLIANGQTLSGFSSASYDAILGARK